MAVRIEKKTIMWVLLTNFQKYVREFFQSVQDFTSNDKLR